MTSPLRALVALGSAGAAIATAHTAWNLRQLRVPGTAGPVAERVSLLLPLRDEALRVRACLAAVLAQRDVPDLEVLVLDDGSTDGTAAAVRATAAGDPRLQLIMGKELPPGWLGKPYACASLAAAATGSVLVFLDADVVLAPTALAATVGLLRTAGLDLVSPYPRQLAGTAAERLVQPLLQWSWLTLLPLRRAESSRRPSLSGANGQLLAVDRRAYERAGGHAAVRGEVLEDVALVRAVKAAGGRGGFADGTAIATCRMYDGWGELRDGYGKSLWSAFGSPAGAAGAAALLAGLYVLPAAAALTGSRVGASGYAAGVLGRVLTGRATGARVLPDAAAHPASVAVLCWLILRSVREHARGELTWKGRVLP